MCPCWWCHEYGDCCRRQLREMSQPGNIYWKFTEIFIEIVEKYLLKRKRNVYWSQVRNLKLPTHKTDEIFAGLFLPFRHHTSSPISLKDILNFKWSRLSMCYWAMSLMYSIQRFNHKNNANDWAAEMEKKEHCRGGVGGEGRGVGNIRQGLRELKRWADNTTECPFIKSQKKRKMPANVL